MEAGRPRPAPTGETPVTPSSSEVSPPAGETLATISTIVSPELELKSPPEQVFALAPASQPALQWQELLRA